MTLTVDQIRKTREFSKTLGGESMPSELAIDVLLEQIDTMTAACESFAHTLEELSRLSVVNEGRTITFLPYQAAKLSRLINESLPKVKSVIEATG